MSDDPIYIAFRDIWDWQRKIEARLKELEKTADLVTDLILKHDKELQRLEEKIRGKG